MPYFCTTTDVSVHYEDFGSLTGSLGTVIIAAASERVQAELLDSYGHILPDSGTNYPFWVKEATVLESIYLGLKRRMDQGQTSSTGFWVKYHDEAMAIIAGIKDGHHVIQSQDTAEWERGIAPALPVANGTVAAPTYGMCFSNSDVPNQWYLGDRPVTFVVEIDGAGTTIETQTYRWQYKYGSAWEESTIELTWGWQELALGAWIRFEDRGSFVVGQQWEIACFPNQGRANTGDGMKSYQLVLAR